MTTVRSAKQKGASFEYDCHESLKAINPNIYLTKQRGFQLQYDLQDDDHKEVFECKRHKGMSWNELIKYFKKLESVAGENTPYLLFKSNNQPCLVMHRFEASPTINLFEDVFNTPFIKHVPIKKNRGETNEVVPTNKAMVDLAESNDVKKEH